MARFKFVITYGSAFFSGNVETVTFSARTMKAAWKLTLAHAQLQVDNGKPSIGGITYEGCN